MLLTLFKKLEFKNVLNSYFSEYRESQGLENLQSFWHLPEKTVKNLGVIAFFEENNSKKMF